MTTQLDQYIGSSIELKGRTFVIDGIATDGDIAIATFKSAKATYQGVRCDKTRVAGKKDAEVWSIISNGKSREIASFAVHEGRIIVLSS